MVTGGNGWYASLLPQGSSESSTHRASTASSGLLTNRGGQDLEQTQQKACRCTPQWGRRLTDLLNAAAAHLHIASILAI